MPDLRFDPFSDEFDRTLQGPPEYWPIGVRGTIYLIHFHTPLCHASHYLGWTTDLDERVALHRSGKGAKILRAATAKGIEWSVVKTWEGTRHDERKLKRGKNIKRICPVCGLTSK